MISMSQIKQAVYTLINVRITDYERFLKVKEQLSRDGKTATIVATFSTLLDLWEAEEAGVNP